MARKQLRLMAFVLLVVGTLGLVLNEFVLGWGSGATLLFAAFNLAGLIVMADGFRRERRRGS